VDGDQFTMVEAGGAFTGSGFLVGDPWRWTSWSSTSEIPHTGITVTSEDELTPTLKLKRKNVETKFKDTFDRLYEDEAFGLPVLSS